MTDKISGACDVCGQPARQFCSSCKAVFYCSKECQKKAWKSHKPQCRPFALQSHPVYGRYIVATRDIKPGEVLLKEAPLVVGPKQSTVPVCLGCHKKIAGNVLCKRCKYPLCSPSCQNSKYHKDECLVLEKASSPMTFSDPGSYHPAYECITPLRCLLLKAKDPKKWESIVNLQSHTEDIQNTSLHKVNQKNIVDFIRIFLNQKDPEDKDGQLIHHICGVLLTNCFELAHNGQRVRGLYHMGSMMAHNCVPNTKHGFDSDKNIVFRATQTIKKGNPIFATYSQTLWDTYSRRHLLKMTKFFLCSCQRCSDPSELESNLGTLLCIKCGGEVRSTDPLDAEADWKCIRCEHQLLAKQIKWGNDAMGTELRSLGRTDPKLLESFLERYTKTLHPNHRFYVEAKYALVKLYGNYPSFYYKDLSEQQIENKVRWAKELVALANILEPCKSMFRGTILFELQAAIVAQAKLYLSNDVITEKRAKEYMTEALKYLQEATEILKQDPQMTDEAMDQKLNWLSKELDL